MFHGRKHIQGVAFILAYIQLVPKQELEILDTPLKFNMEPENGGLEDDFPFQLGAF